MRELETQNKKKTKGVSKISILESVLSPSFKFDLARAMLIFSVLFLIFSSFAYAGNVVVTNGRLNITDDFRIGNNVLFVNATSANIGFGTIKPGLKLDIFGDANISGGLNVTQNLLISSGRVGIGTSTPGYALEVIGSGNFSGGLNVSNNILVANGRIGIQTTTPTAYLQVGAAGDQASTLRVADRLEILGANTVDFSARVNNGGALSFSTIVGGVTFERMRINNTGQVSIGAQVPSALLDINSSSADLLLNVRNSGTSYLVVNRTSGNVGIGITGPNDKLDVRDGSIALSDADTAHGITGVTATSNFGFLTIDSSTDGGLRIYGLSDLDVSTQKPFRLIGAFGADPSDTVPGIEISANRRSGTGVVDLAATETVLQVANNDNVAALTILGNDNVGIGTATPSVKLHINGSGNIVNITGVSGQGVGIVMGSDTFWTIGPGRGQTGNANDFTFTTNSSTHVWITGNGNVGIGTRDPLSKLHINGTGALLNISNSTQSFLYVTGDTGNVGIGTTAPDLALTVQSSKGGMNIKNNAGEIRALGLEVSTNGNAYIGTATTAGSIFFETGHTSNDLPSTGTMRMVINGSTGNVGIGTTNPGVALDVIGSGNFSGGLNVTQNLKAFSRVGINTTTPLVPLQIMEASSVNSQSKLLVGSFDTAASLIEMQADLGQNSGDFAYIMIKDGDGALTIDQSDGNAGKGMLTIANTGIGIGTKTTTEMLRINGSLLVTNDGSGGQVVFFIDNGTRNVGIGTIAPSHNLTVQGRVNITDNLTVDTTTLHVDSNNNRVGIGTTVPSVRLHMSENVSGLSQFYIENIANNSASDAVQIVARLGYNISERDTGGQIRFGKEQQWTPTASTRDGFITFMTAADGSADARVRIASSGNVGIGTTNPGTALDVIGSGNFSGGLNVTQRLKVYGGIQLDDGQPIVWHPTSGAFNNGINGSDVTNTLIFRTNTADRITIASTGNIGIGTANPQSKLHINGTGALLNISNSTQSFLYVTGDTGNVGIGTTAPGAKLEVDTSTGSASTVAGIFRNSAESNTYDTQIQIGREASTGNILVLGHRYASADNSDVGFINMNGDSIGTGLSIRYGGNIGIGTTTPTHNLTVNGNVGINITINSTSALTVGGNINATGTIYRDAGTAVTDYIFDNYFDGKIDLKEYPYAKDYDFVSLNELRDYLAENRHLPRLPGKKLTGNVDTAEIDRLLLEKLEENTVYIVELNSKLEEQQAEIEELKRSVSLLTSIKNAATEPPKLVTIMDTSLSAMPSSNQPTSQPPSQSKGVRG